ncbi:putative transcription factor C2H2 family [Helianthus annuus]|nr:putative transcription factor C2H2 family [Helianthus annuus]KAJ0739657.1 putative transcription factor C2H2 family [Helianthus annuus]
MAVQAHSSSNILLLNRTSLGKHHTRNNYSLPPQPGGNFLHHQMFNNYPVVNQGKRRREDDNMNQFMSSLHQQSYSNQLMDVSQIHSRNVDVSTGLRLAFNDHQQHHHSFDPQSSGFVSPSDFSNLINQQRDEIEHYLQAQGEELRRKLAEKRQRHYHALIGVVKESATRIIREKEAVAERAARRNAELEARATQLSAEVQVWEAKARAQEAVAAALQAELQQAVVAGTCVSQVEEVAAADAESSYIDPERVVVVSGPGCKACGKRVASVVLLPCRHLCVCSECDDVVQACPLCLSLRSSSIEVYMS